MYPDRTRTPGYWERGVVILSIDTEQRWGYLDQLDDAQFERRFPDALGTHDRLLAALQRAGVSATWFVVGGMTLRGCRGSRDRRMAGLPPGWVAAIPAGSETTMPLWYRPSFLERLRLACPIQEIGLHGGLTHFLWTDPRATRRVVEWELVEGVRALEQAGLRPVSFSFGRELEAHHDLLRRKNLRAYRGRTVSLGHRLGSSMTGKLVRAASEAARFAPPLIWPQETLPGLWNIPASLFLYPLGGSRSRLIGVRSRIGRFKRGVELAARSHGIFHYCLHPENLAEAPCGASLFDEMLDSVTQARRKGDIEVLTVSEVAARMEESLDSTAGGRSSITASRAGVSAASEPVCGPEPLRNERNKPE